jgi:ankyrin repeat protein
LVQRDDMEGIADYVRRGRELELKDHWGRTALFWALSNEKYGAVDILLTSQAAPNSVDETGFSLFHQTVVWGKYDLASQLLESGANIDAYNGNQDRETVLHYCVMKDKPDCVRFLLEHGANRYLKDSYGYTVFERVKTHEHISQEVAQLLANDEGLK